MPCPGAQLLAPPLVSQVPAHTVAALKFRGHIRDRKVVEEKKRQLLEIMQARGDHGLA